MEKGMESKAKQEAIIKELSDFSIEFDRLKKDIVDLIQTLIGKYDEYTDIHDCTLSEELDEDCLELAESIELKIQLDICSTKSKLYENLISLRETKKTMILSIHKFKDYFYSRYSPTMPSSNVCEIRLMELLEQCMTYLQIHTEEIDPHVSKVERSSLQPLQQYYYNMNYNVIKEIIDNYS